MADLVFVLVVWHRDAPFEPPGDAPRLEPSLEPSVGHMDGVLAPGPISRGTIDVALQLLLQQGELQEQEVGAVDAGRAPANLKSEFSTQGKEPQG